MIKTLRVFDGLAICTITAYYNLFYLSVYSQPNLFDWEFELKLTLEQQTDSKISDYDTLHSLKSLGATKLSGDALLRDWNIVPSVATYHGSGALEILGNDARLFFPKCILKGRVGIEVQAAQEEVGSV